MYSRRPEPLRDFRPERGATMVAGLAFELVLSQYLGAVSPALSPTTTGHSAQKGLETLRSRRRRHGCWYFFFFSSLLWSVFVRIACGRFALRVCGLFSCARRLADWPLCSSKRGKTRLLRRETAPADDSIAGRCWNPTSSSGLLALYPDNCPSAECVENRHQTANSPPTVRSLSARNADDMRTTFGVSAGLCPS